jgi:hypothetical protein
MERLIQYGFNIPVAQLQIRQRKEEGSRDIHMGSGEMTILHLQGLKGRFATTLMLFVHITLMLRSTCQSKGYFFQFTTTIKLLYTQTDKGQGVKQ